MKKFIDLTGKKFGSLSVIDRASKTPSGIAIRWNCICDCGTRTIVHSQSIREGRTVSCGCARKGTPIHGKSATREFFVWASIIQRCCNPKSTGFKDYGGRGIRVCDAWRHGFPQFWADMGPRPSPKHSIEREDTNGDYTPQNCRWATDLEQANNRRNTRFVEYNGKRMALTDAVRAAGSVIHHQAAWNRIARSGWTVERALETPRTMESPNSKSRKMRRTVEASTS